MPTMTTPSTIGGGHSVGPGAKGKGPEVVQPIVISEGEFELVVRMFEKKTEFLHHVRMLAHFFCIRPLLLNAEARDRNGITCILGISGYVRCRVASNDVCVARSSKVFTTTTGQSGLNRSDYIPILERTPTRTGRSSDYSYIEREC
jgi:hypothetical protein